MRLRTPWSLAAALTSIVVTAAASDPIAPFVEFLGQRFAISDASISASDGIAFRASDASILSLAHTSVCGAPASDAVGTQGIALDPLSDRFWHIDGTRVVREVVSETPYATQIVFEIPETFDVPGVGPSTLHAPRGLAVDDTHVYVVDAGPDLGEQTSNQWFKFTRTGTPVSSSALTDFVDHLDFGLDSVVDGIHRIPEEAPYGNGLFLVAVEHSGFLVIDEDGFFVDRLAWDEAGLPLGAIPFAFSGVTMDPTEGDIYLVENSGSKCHVWTRLPPEPAAVLYLPGAGRIEMREPATACTRFLHTNAPDDPIFGIAYQPESGLLFMPSYNSGEVWAVDPRSGFSTVAGTTLVNIWGFDWDGTRSVFHAHVNGALYHLDPSTFDATPLPGPTTYSFTDLTYSPDHDALFALTFIASHPMGSGNYLIRLDPDLGTPTVVGPSISGDGIAYDAIDERLLVITRDGPDNEIAAIDPLTGGTVGLEAYGVVQTREALAIIPSHTGVVHVDDSPEPVTSGLRAWPNPARRSAQVTIGSANGLSGRLSVFDVAGRRVRDLDVRGRATRVSWDGRDDRRRLVVPGVYFVHGVDGAITRVVRVP